MNVELWHLVEDRCISVGPFAWIWAEGQTLWGGLGPEFGEEDPTRTAIATLEDGLWLRDGRLYTDWDARAA